MGSQYLLTCVCFWLPLVSFTISVASQKSTTGPGNVIEGNVFINGTTSIGRIDDDFVCATLDWWPPEKCDYGTCSWGRDSLLNLVSWSSLKWFFFSFLFFASLWVLSIKSESIFTNFFTEFLSFSMRLYYWPNIFS